MSLGLLREPLCDGKEFTAKKKPLNSLKLAKINFLFRVISRISRFKFFQ